MADSQSRSTNAGSQSANLAQPSLISEQVQIVFMRPIPTLLQQLKTQLEKDGNNKVLECTATEASSMVRGVAPALIIGYMASKEDVFAQVNLLKAIREETYQKLIRPIVISPIKEAALINALSAQGVYEFIAEPINEKALYFKVGISVKAMAVLRKQMRQLQLKAQGKSQVQTAGNVAAKTIGSAAKSAEAQGLDDEALQKRIKMIDPKDTGADVWMLSSKTPVRKKGKWRFQLKGPNPSVGDWKNFGKTASGAERWFFIENKPEREKLFWEWVGDRPYCDHDEWTFESTMPELVLVDQYGWKKATKITTDSVGGLVLTKDKVEILKRKEQEEAVKEERRRSFIEKKTKETAELEFERAIQATKEARAAEKRETQAAEAGQAAQKPVEKKRHAGPQEAGEMTFGVVTLEMPVSEIGSVEGSWELAGSELVRSKKIKYFVFMTPELRRKQVQDYTALKEWWVFRGDKPHLNAAKSMWVFSDTHLQDRAPDAPQKFQSFEGLPELVYNFLLASSPHQLLKRRRDAEKRLKSARAKHLRAIEEKLGRKVQSTVDEADVVSEGLEVEGVNDNNLTEAELDVGGPGRPSGRGSGRGAGGVLEGLLAAEGELGSEAFDPAGAAEADGDVSFEDDFFSASARRRREGHAGPLSAAIDIQVGPTGTGEEAESISDLEAALEEADDIIQAGLRRRGKGGGPLEAGEVAGQGAADGSGALGSGDPEAALQADRESLEDALAALDAVLGSTKRKGHRAGRTGGSQAGSIENIDPSQGMGDVGELTPEQERALLEARGDLEAALYQTTDWLQAQARKRRGGGVAGGTAGQTDGADPDWENALAAGLESVSEKTADEIRADMEAVLSSAEDVIQAGLHEWMSASKRARTPGNASVDVGAFGEGSASSESTGEAGPAEDLAGLDSDPDAVFGSIAARKKRSKMALKAEVSGVDLDSEGEGTQTGDSSDEAARADLEAAMASSLEDADASFLSAGKRRRTKAKIDTADSVGDIDADLAEGTESEDNDEARKDFEGALESGEDVIAAGPRRARGSRGVVQAEVLNIDESGVDAGSQDSSETELNEIDLDVDSDALTAGTRKRRAKSGVKINANAGVESGEAIGTGRSGDDAEAVARADVEGALEAENPAETQNVDSVFGQVRRRARLKASGPSETTDSVEALTSSPENAEPSVADEFESAERAAQALDADALTLKRKKRKTREKLAAGEVATGEAGSSGSEEDIAGEEGLLQSAEEVERESEEIIGALRRRQSERKSAGGAVATAPDTEGAEAIRGMMEGDGDASETQDIAADVESAVALDAEWERLAARRAGQRTLRQKEKGGTTPVQATFEISGEGEQEVVVGTNENQEAIKKSLFGKKEKVPQTTSAPMAGIFLAEFLSQYRGHHLESLQAFVNYLGTAFCQARVAIFVMAANHHPRLFCSTDSIYFGSPDATVQKAFFQQAIREKKWTVDLNDPGAIYVPIFPVRGTGDQLIGVVVLESVENPVSYFEYGTYLQAVANCFRGILMQEQKLLKGGSSPHNDSRSKVAA